MPVLEGPSLGVAFQNSLVCPLVNLHQPILVFLLVEIIDQPWGILKSKVCSTFFFFFFPFEEVNVFQNDGFVSITFQACKIMGCFSSSLSPG